MLDAASLGPDPTATAGGLYRAGVDWIQLRDRTLEGDALLALTRSLVAARDRVRTEPNPRSSGPCVIVNRRLDVAIAADADGVHLGFDGFDPRTAARLLPENAPIGASLHAVGEIRALLETTSKLGGRYVHLAPIWDPLSKPATRPPLGAGLLRSACQLGIPVLAQGGIDPDRAAEAITAGAAGIAVTGSLSEAHTREEAAARLRAALDGQSSPRG